MGRILKRSARILSAGLTIFGLALTGCSARLLGNGSSTVEPLTSDSSSPVTSSISISNVPSRISGVAPLAVFFDASATTALATARPFHDLEYRWDFGDPAAGTWNNGARAGEGSKNFATGAITAHLYESPGTYQVTLEVMDGTQTASDRTITITVDDPDVLFASNTTCIAAVGTDFTGCPMGAATVTNSDFKLALSSALTGGARRILFKRGDTFTTGASMTTKPAEAVLIGAFGTGARPIVRATVAGVFVIAVVGVSDWRVMDLEIDGQSLIPTVRSLNVTATNFTALRIFAHDLGYGVSIGGNNIAIVDTDTQRILGGNGNLGMWLSDVFGLFVAGNHVDNNGGGEHGIRFQGGRNAIFSNNTIERPAANKHLFTLRGDSTQVTYLTEFHMVSDNLFDCSLCSGVAWTTTIAPQNNFVNERIQNVIVERNHYKADAGVQSQLILTASDTTVRNNLFDFTSGSGHVINLTYSGNSGGLPARERDHIYHNTFFSNSTGGFTGIRVSLSGLSILDTEIKNNFAYAPNALKAGDNNGTGPTLLSDQGTNTVTTNNSTNAQIKSASPNLAAAPPSASSDWTLPVGSYGIDAGASVAVWSDFFLNVRPRGAASDLGAMEY